MDLEQATAAVITIVVQAGLRIFGAVALWLAGRWLISSALTTSGSTGPARAVM